MGEPIHVSERRGRPIRGRGGATSSIRWSSDWSCAPALSAEEGVQFVDDDVVEPLEQRADAGCRG